MSTIFAPVWAAWALIAGGCDPAPHEDPIAGGPAAGEPCAGEDPCSDAEGVGQFRVEHCDGSSSLVFESMTCEQALLNCGFNQDFNPNTSIYCEWNGVEIDRVEYAPVSCDDLFGPTPQDCDPDPPECVPQDPCADAEGVGAFHLEHCDGSTFLDFEFLTCEDSLDICEQAQLENPNTSIYCEWNGTELDRVEHEPVLCDVFGPKPPQCDDPDPPQCDPDDPCADADGVGQFRVEHCDGSSSLVFESMTCEQAVLNCGFNQDFNPNTSIYCEWNGVEIDRVEYAPVSCDDLFGPAREHCEDPPPPQCDPDDPCGGAEGVGDFRVEHCDGSSSLVFESLTCEQALQNCGFNQDFNPNTSIYCEWNGVEIDRVEYAPVSCDDLFGPAPECEEAAG